MNDGNGALVKQPQPTVVGDTKWEPIELELCDAVFWIRFVGQKRRDDIADKNTKRMAGSITGELNVPRYQEDMADELIAGWEKVTQVTAMRLGYEDFDKLPVDAEGFVPYTIPTARKLYRFCLRDRFGNEIDNASRNMGEALYRAKKFGSGSSATSSEPTT